MKNSNLFLILLISLFIISCKDNDSEAPISFEFEILNSTDQPNSTFSPNDKVFFSFKITNNSLNNIVWYNYCDIFQDENLFSIYKLNEPDGSNNKSYSYLGKPLTQPVECNDMPTILKVGEGYYFRTPSDKAPNSILLQTGHYKVEFDLSFKINDFKKISKSFIKEFDIK